MDTNCEEIYKMRYGVVFGTLYIFGEAFVKRAEKL